LVVFVGRGIQTQQLYTISFVGVTVSVPTGFQSICTFSSGYPLMCRGKEIAVKMDDRSAGIFSESTICYSKTVYIPEIKLRLKF
jgi:hypothetical protein